MKRSSRMLLVLVLLVGASLLCGCASLGPPFQKVTTISDNQGLIYIYRPSGFVGSGVSYDVKTGDKVITTLYSGGYFPYFSQPGEVELWAKTESRTSITLDVKPGETYYLKGTVGVGFFVGRPHLIIVAPEIAEKEIAECKLIPEKKAGD